MPYTGDPQNNPVDAIRLITGDIWDDMEYLSDNDYKYYLARNQNKERPTAIECMRSILLKLSRGARERAGDIEVYGAEYFANYLAALTLVLKNPDIAISLAVPYAGGISKSDMFANDINGDSPTRSIYIGFHNHQKLYNQINPDAQLLDYPCGVSYESYGFGNGDGYGSFYG